MAKDVPTLYAAIIEHIFFAKDFGNYQAGMTTVEFDREHLPKAATALGRSLPKNLGDVVYSIRYRTPMPPRIAATQPEGMEWVIEGIGRSRYAFRLLKRSRIQPRADLLTIKIPDATPELMRIYRLNDEQALLAVVRYNRLVDVFLGITAFSLQNHLRTTITNGTQIEIDELYIGIDKRGAHYVVPLQAKGGKDQINVVQTRQDIAWCTEELPEVRCRPVAAQFMDDDVIAMFELAVDKDEVKVVEERHYKLTPGDKISLAERTSYGASS